MPDVEPGPASEGPEIATSTLAEIYAQQGLHGRAIEIYRRIQRRDPTDERVAARIAELEAAAERSTGEEADEPAPPEGGASSEPGPDGNAAGGGTGPPAADADAEFLAWLERR